jgi:hypothetical protein
MQAFGRKSIATKKIYEKLFGRPCFLDGGSYLDVDLEYAVVDSYL